MVDLLLSRGANVDAVVQNECSMLYIAAMNNRLDLVKLLVDKGANVNAAASDSGFTPLHIACMMGHTEVRSSHTLVHTYM